MRLMCSQNQAEVEAVKNELFRAGIVAECRPNPMAEALGVNATELWVQDERDFFDASRLYAQLQRRASGKPDEAPADPQPELPEQYFSAEEPALEPYQDPDQDVSGTDLTQVAEPRREELKQASSLLERGIEQMFRREGELAEECALLRNQLEELNQALVHQKAALVRETEARTAAERKHGEKITSLLSTQERERHEWRQQLKSRDEAVKQAQEKLDSTTRLLQAEQTAAVGLREEMVSLQLQHEELQESLSQAREEVAADRQARLAAEERATKATEAQAALERQLVNRKDLEQQIQNQVASLSALCSRMGAE